MLPGMPEWWDLQFADIWKPEDLKTSYREMGMNWICEIRRNFNF